MPARLPIALLAGAAAASSAGAQYAAVPAFLTYGGPTSDYGISVSGAGDVNGDGFNDLIIGAHLDDSNGINSGSAQVLSGRTGTTLYTFHGDGVSDLFGASVSGAGDVDNDGFDDLIVGATGDDNNGSSSGSARVFSGRTGAILYTFNGAGANATFGSSVSDAGDVNNDGFDDVIVGAPYDDAGGLDKGSARVFSGATGGTLYTFSGDMNFDLFGFSVSSAGDVNKDGFDDFIVGALLANNHSGRATVFSGSTGAIIYNFNGNAISDQFGSSVSSAGDVNNDSFVDLIIGANSDDRNGLNSGSASVFSGADGSVLHLLGGDAPGDSFGNSVSGAGDVNNDGFDDLIVGAPSSDNNGPNSGLARVFSGASGAVLATMYGDRSHDWLGVSVSGAGDINGDGFADLLVGAYLDDYGGADSGTARVFVSVAWTCSSPPAPCPGDADSNRTVNFADITSVLTFFNTTCP